MELLKLSAKAKITTFATKEKQSTQLTKSNGIISTQTTIRTTKYAKFLNGILHVEDKVEDIQLSYKFLHAVDVEHHRVLFHDWASPIWTDLEVMWYAYGWFVVAQLTLLLVCMNATRFDYRIPR
ncbi:hypothetical protein PHMEG_00034177 [Phytophthora megakarya]|uniref:Transmembrane protein n=1 Tax=Phytophthora megakarya TaxID=4795 RepID=A0A225URW9_9STRA|nr:hypothetical protein PHMEG_00034177 [Phytophthora megakarya]